MLRVPSNGSLRRGARLLLRALLQPPCLACGGEMDVDGAAGDEGAGAPLCERCRGSLRVPSEFLCEACGVEIAPMQAAERPVCRACEAHTPAFVRLRSATRFGRVARLGVHRFKFHRRTDLAPLFVERMTAAYHRYFAEEGIEAIVPVPLHWAREFQRGFNQATLLAEGLSAALRLPCERGALERTRYTSQQAFLGPKDRRANLLNAFALRDAAAVHGLRVLLVDDVATTGATIHEAAAALVRGGARAAHGLVFTRASV